MSLATTINGTTTGSYNVRFDVNGYVTGFGLGVTAGLGVTPTYSEFIVRSDIFAIGQPTSSGSPTVSPVLPFTCYTASWTDANGYTQPAGVYMNYACMQTAKIGAAQIGTAEIASGAITNALIGTAAIESANIATANIETLHVAGGGITQAQYANTLNVLCTISISVTGVSGETYPILILARSTAGCYLGSSVGDVDVLLDGTVIGSYTAGGGQPDFFASLLLPAACSVGSHTIQVVSSGFGPIPNPYTSGSWAGYLTSGATFFHDLYVLVTKR